MLASPGNITSEKKYIEAMMKAIRAQGSECVWIGSPDLAKTPFSKNLQNGVTTLKALADKNNCHFVEEINSLNLKPITEPLPVTFPH